MAGTADAVDSAEQATAFGPDNPFYSQSTLPYHAPPFDRIRDTDYLPAFEAGRTLQLQEIRAIAENAAAPTFDNTILPLERSGQLYHRALAAFFTLAGANTNPMIEAIQASEAPRMAAHRDAIYLNEALFARIYILFLQIDQLPIDAESRRALEVYHQRFVHAGANLSAGGKATLRLLNEEESTLTNRFRTHLMAASRASAFVTADAATLRGLSEPELAAAAAAASTRGIEGYLVPLQNTTQQPVFSSLAERATREAIFHSAWTRTQRGDANDTRKTITRLVTLRAEKANLLGFSTYAAWKLEDQMTRTPEAAIRFMDALVPAASAHARAEAAEIQAVIDAQGGGFILQPWDWDFYAEHVRKARYDLDEEQIKPYFEVTRVLKDGVFYAAAELYGITFRQRHDIPVWHPDVSVFEIFDGDSSPLALFYFDPFKRDSKQGGAWMSSLVDQSRLLGDLPVIINVCNMPAPAPGAPALISFDEVRTMFHEFGHALHGIFSSVQYPLLAGTDVARDFVEFPSQFNEHWANWPSVFANYAKHCETAEPMPQDLVEKLRRAHHFNQGYALTEVLAAAQLDMQWHTLPAPADVVDPDAFEQAALERKQLALPAVPPRYRSSYFQHIFAGGYSAAYYAYLWSEMLDNNAFQWFKDNGGLTRANGDRLRRMVLSRGNSQDPAAMYAAWLGAEPSADSLLTCRGLAPAL